MVVHVELAGWLDVKSSDSTCMYQFPRDFREAYKYDSTLTVFVPGWRLWSRELVDGTDVSDLIELRLCRVMSIR